VGLFGDLSNWQSLAIILQYLLKASEDEFARWKADAKSDVLMG